MQTFLPYESFARSASVLDLRRLGKQRVEALQIYRAGHWEKYGWKNHPAVVMWRDHPEALIAYGVAICDEWIARGHKDTVREQLLACIERPVSDQATLREGAMLPPWVRSRTLHRSHQSALVRKDSVWYRRFFPDTPDDLPYYWPSKAPT